MARWMAAAMLGLVPSLVFAMGSRVGNVGGGNEGAKNRAPTTPPTRSGQSHGAASSAW